MLVNEGRSTVVEKYEELFEVISLVTVVTWRP